MDARELALLYLMQRHTAPEEPSALGVWEELISDKPEEAWPVFEEVLRRTSDDDTLEQVWYRLHLLLYRHYDAFHARAAELFGRFPRFAFVAGPEALNADQYREEPLDREELIDAYRAIHRTHEAISAVANVAAADPQRALTIATEIIHRGVDRGWDAFDVMSPLQEVLMKSAPLIIERLEELARTSVSVRRVLWRLQRQTWTWPMNDAEWAARLERASGGTTDYTEREIPSPPPVRQSDADERIIADWFVHEENFWAFSALSDLCSDDPRLAWSITLDLIERAADESELGAIAAGPLEDLIRAHADILWPDLTQRAHTNPKFLAALRGVWIFETDGEVYERFRSLMDSVDGET